MYVSAASSGALKKSSNVYVPDKKPDIRATRHLTASESALRVQNVIDALQLKGSSSRWRELPPAPPTQKPRPEEVLQRTVNQQPLRSQASSCGRGSAPPIDVPQRST
jgi:hypothetical protein